MGKVQDVKRFKNMISSYESRLLKRAKVEDTKDQLNVRTLQIQSILSILSTELTQIDLLRVTDRIRTEAPKMVRGATILENSAED